jgi:polysaccharide export outer membrane protein
MIFKHSLLSPVSLRPPLLVEIVLFLELTMVLGVLPVLAQPLPGSSGAGPTSSAAGLEPPSIRLVQPLAEAKPVLASAATVAPATSAPAGYASSTYTLGPGDQIVVRVTDVDEITDKPIPIDLRGNIDLPLVGRVAAAGLTTAQLEDAIADHLKKYLVDPDVSVYLAEMRSQPVSVLGAVQTPGVHQLEGEKTLFEVLSLAGGLRQDAGNTVKITRKLEWGRLPLPDAKDDSTGQFSVASVSVKDVMSASDPSENIIIKPEDVVSVPSADVIYAIGAVNKPGGYVLGVNQSLSVLQILSLAQGLEHTASTSNVKIMRLVPGTSTRAEIPVDLKKILDGKGSDMPLQADDILFVPNSKSKTVAYRTVEALAQGSTLLFYRIP